ncbi:Uncharacterised protein [Citrobacter amalonaticus]|uniref:hypothetical protein n=1 Tax=Citrobacter amalonaticus TaxID=35703 RepID=UPI000E17B8DF|nr:hypothetical protein [Citrobacter amalonaticus]UBI21064.1 hypothetical protein LA348_02540 [Citrobacter amalonaticus]BCU51203.1 hypothetical protein CIAM_47240 [Citrobacter amalonaticus]SUX60535.1 Uncharacterised protein [Citrobacter amalonaticus]
MSNLDDEYTERLEDLLEDMESDGVDATRILMSAVASHVEGALEAEGGDGYMYQFEDMDLIIIIRPTEDEQPETIARLH